jgi:SAM-dependent methyltransferase
MNIDVADLRDFYASSLGQMARRIVGHRIRARWRPETGGVLVGLGFASPYLGAFRGEASCIGALMPQGQGALIWPAAGPTHSVLVEEDRLPLPDNCVDRLLVVHCLELAERTAQMLREMWRVLSPRGSLLIVVPNRRGVWARLDTTPFGYGRPFSRSQLEHLLTEAMFSPLSCNSALYTPPFDRSLLVRSAVAMERIGTRISPAFGGVLILEARKETTALISKPVRTKALRDLVRVPGARLVAGGSNGGGSSRRLAGEEEDGLLTEQVLQGQRAVDRQRCA